MDVPDNAKPNSFSEVGSGFGSVGINDVTCGGDPDKVVVLRASGSGDSEGPAPWTTSPWQPREVKPISDEATRVRLTSKFPSPFALIAGLDACFSNSVWGPSEPGLCFCLSSREGVGCATHGHLYMPCGTGSWPGGGCRFFLTHSPRRTRLHCTHTRTLGEKSGLGGNRETFMLAP